MIKMVVFDMAGTTVNEDNVVYKTLRDTLNDAGQSLSLQEVLRSAAGKEKRQAISGLIKVKEGEDAEAQIDAAYEAFLARLSKAYATLPVQPMPGAERLLAYLRAQGVKVVLNTGYNRATALHLLGRMAWEEGVQFDLLVTADQVSCPRPAPDMIELAMEKLGVKNAGEVAKIGDSKIDVEEGKNAGCGLTVGITTGAQTAEQLREAAPDKIIDRLEDLMVVLRA